MGTTSFGGDRPEHFFGKRKTQPEDAETRLRFPECLDEFDGSRESAIAALERSLEQHVQRAHAAVKEKG